MKRINPRRIAARPGLLGIACATVLLAVCFVFPDETLGVKTQHLFSIIIIAGCFLYAVLRK